MNLPKIIPIFPLSNFIIFPKTTVPLNIFETRYLEMINDSMKTEKFIGMVQPKTMKNFDNSKTFINLLLLNQSINSVESSLYFSN